MTPYDSRSTGIIVAFTKGLLPSNGSPRALTTRPSSSSPDGTERILPVDFIVIPSCTRAESPKIVARTPSSSRLRTSPKITPADSIPFERVFPDVRSEEHTSELQSQFHL